MAFYSVIGLEITEKTFILSQIQSENNTPYVVHTKIAEMPPKVLSDGVITDPDLLAEHLMRVIQEAGITAQEVVVSIPDQSYVKALEKFPILKSQDLSLELQMRVASHRFFSRGDFQLGHQIFKEPPVGKVAKPYQSVLYAAVTQAQVDSINQLVDAMGLNLVAVDLPGLAAVRCMKWRRPAARTPWLSLFLDAGYLDCYVVWQDSIVFTQTIHLDEIKFSESPEYSNTIVERLDRFLLAYSNMYPHFEPVSHCCFASRNDGGPFLLDRIMTSFPDIQFQLFSPTDTISIESSLLAGSIRPDFSDCLVSIGLGLKYFEKNNQTLSLTKLKKRFNPIVDKKQFGIAVTILGVAFLLCKSIQFYIAHNTSLIGKNVEDTKHAIEALQSGEFLTRQKQLESYQVKIKAFAGVRLNDYPRYELMRLISDGLPGDIAIQSMSITDLQKVDLKASAYYQESIFMFFEKLKKTFSDVSISNISSQTGSQGAQQSEFHILFSWNKK